MDSSYSGSDSSRLLSSNDEKTYDFETPRSKSTSWYRKPVIWTALGLSSVLVLIIITLSAIVRTRSTGFIPALSTEPVLFTPDYRFNQSSGKHSPWNELIPMGKGFVKVPLEQQQGLGGSHVLHDGSGEYCLSVFHQIHCLAMIRNTINNLRAGKPEEHDHHHRRDSEPSEDGGWHVDHCVDYLRQAVMCSGDMTLEHYKQYDDGTFGPGVDGYSIQHQCRSWDQIMDFAATHRSRDVKGVS